MVGLDSGAIMASTEARRKRQFIRKLRSTADNGAILKMDPPSRSPPTPHAVQAVDDVRAKGMVVTEDEGCGTSLLAMPGATQDGSR